jgi:hypothetical protein
VNKLLLWYVRLGVISQVLITTVTTTTTTTTTALHRTDSRVLRYQIIQHPHASSCADFRRATLGTRLRKGSALSSRPSVPGRRDQFPCIS